MRQVRVLLIPPASEIQIGQLGAGNIVVVLPSHKPYKGKINANAHIRAQSRGNRAARVENTKRPHGEIGLQLVESDLPIAPLPSSSDTRIWIVQIHIEIA